MILRNEAIPDPGFFDRLLSRLGFRATPPKEGMDS
jgi:hypothetical protein